MRGSIWSVSGEILGVVGWLPLILLFGPIGLIVMPFLGLACIVAHAIVLNRRPLSPDLSGAKDP